jgi:hypothetical protein
MRTFLLFAVILVFFCPSALFGQEPIHMIGNELYPSQSLDGDVGVVRTDIDLNQPAMYTGSVSLAKVMWSTSGIQGCTISFKIKFFRRVADTLTMTAERGPFTPNANPYTATLTPPVPVQQGDLIAITRLTDCGSPTKFWEPGAEGYLQYPGDLTGTVDMASATSQGGMLLIGGWGQVTEIMLYVIPVVGSTPGALGSFFRTELQILRPHPGLSDDDMVCKMVFRRAGVPGSSADRTRLINLKPGEMFSTADVVADMGGSGLGSLDISFFLPMADFTVMIARVYNDAGAAGTSSLTEQPLVAHDYTSGDTTKLDHGDQGFLLTPRDPLRTRFNVGVRTLYKGATIMAELRDSRGVEIRRKRHTYTANYFVQMPVQDFVGGPIAGNESIMVHVTSGSAFVYASTTDNVTNDPSIQFARRFRTVY